MTDDDERLETPKQLAGRVGITERQVRHLVQIRQLEHVPIGRRIFIPVGAFARFLEAKKVAPCQDETKAPDCAGSPSAAATISSGPRGAAWEAQVRGLIRAGRIAYVMVGTRRMIPAQQLKISSRKTRCCQRRLTGDTFAQIANPQLCSARTLNDGG
jgi:hypothetical protein